jgi:integrase
VLIWREHYRRDGPVFVGIHRSGAYLGRLTGHAVARIVKRYVAASGLKPELFAGHSMRSGFATSAAAGGATERAIMGQTGHRSVATVRRYIREGELFVKHPLVETGL